LKRNASWIPAIALNDKEVAGMRKRVCGMTKESHSMTREKIEII